jgi:hypothetical protein
MSRLYKWTYALFLCAVINISSPSLFAQDAEPEETEPTSTEMTGTPEQDDVSKALDSTATQWSFQFAWQGTEWKTDEASVNPRPQGHDNFAQLRVVAPFVFDSFTLLPRLTLRHYENLNTGKSGLGNTELFGLIIPRKWDWGSGRMGLGPLITMPGNKDVARDEWGYGFAAAIVNTSGNWFYGLLFTQSWRAVDPLNLPAGSSDTNPLGIAPFLNYQLGGGWYVGNGDMVMQYDWDSNEFYVPIGVRIGKVIAGNKGSWNLYAEYSTSLVYDDWPGAAKDKAFRLNITKTLPAGF